MIMVTSSATRGPRHANGDFRSVALIVSTCSGMWLKNINRRNGEGTPPCGSSDKLFVGFPTFIPVDVLHIT